MKTKSPTLFAFAAFDDESRRFGLRVRRVAVVQIFAPLECAAVEFRGDSLRPVGRIVPFGRLSTAARDLRKKIRAAFREKLLRRRPGFPAASL